MIPGYYFCCCYCECDLFPTIVFLSKSIYIYIFIPHCMDKEAVPEKIGVLAVVAE